MPCPTPLHTTRIANTASIGDSRNGTEACSLRCALQFEFVCRGVGSGLLPDLLGRIVEIDRDRPVQAFHVLLNAYAVQIIGAYALPVPRR